MLERAKTQTTIHFEGTIMNRITLKHIALVASLLMAGATQAQTAESYPFNLDPPVVATKTRAQVLEELEAARAAGELRNGEAYPHNITPTHALQAVMTVEGQVLVAEGVKPVEQFDQSLYVGA
jgi:hypothetical protein